MIRCTVMREWSFPGRFAILDAEVNQGSPVLKNTTNNKQTKTNQLNSLALGRRALHLGSLELSMKDKDTPGHPR